MPLLRYFITVGTILTVGLFALSSYLEPLASEAGARVSVAPTTASLLYFGPQQVKTTQKSK
jgi:hypothetical protein